MSSQKAGLTFEKDLAADIHNNTDALVVFGGGMSGNVRIPQPDLLIVTDGITHAIEVKRSSRDRFYIEYGDFLQLEEVRADDRWLLHKFTNREVVMWHIDDIPPTEFEPHTTIDSSLRIDKPDTDVWPSAQSGKDAWEIVTETLSLS